MQRASQITKRPACPAFLFGFAALAFAEPLKLEIAEAKADRDQRTREPIVSIRMTKESSQAFAAITQRHLGKPMEFRIDGKVVMAPIIREPVLGGSIVILGNFTTEEVSEMVRKIQAGALIEVAVPEAFAEAGQALRHAHFSSAPQGTK